MELLHSALEYSPSVLILKPKVWSFVHSHIYWSINITDCYLYIIIIGWFGDNSISPHEREKKSSFGTLTHLHPKPRVVGLFLFMCSLNKASFFRSLKNSLTVPDKTKLLAVYSLLINSIQSVTLAPSFGNSVAHDKTLTHN